MAKRWNPPPLSLGWRDIGRARVAQDTREIDGELGLHIVGDAQTFTTGESFTFPATLGRRRERKRSRPVAESDVLLAVTRRAASSSVELGYRQLFGAKTQRFPYHTLILALGLLVENSLPRIAMVHGDISLRDAEASHRGLTAILEEALKLPVVLDEKRMRHRLGAAMDGALLERAINDLKPPDEHLIAFAADVLGMFDRTPAGRVRHELQHVVLSCPDAGLLARDTRLMLHDLVEAIHGCMARHKIRQRVGQWGAVRTREAIALQAMSRMRFTSMTWDAIEAADLEELAFVYTAVCVHTTEWHLHHALRAVIENRRIRRG